MISSSRERKGGERERELSSVAAHNGFFRGKREVGGGGDLEGWVPDGAIGALAGRVHGEDAVRSDLRGDQRHRLRRLPGGRRLRAPHSPRLIPRQTEEALLLRPIRPLGLPPRLSSASLINTLPAVIFLLAVASGRESFSIFHVSSQAKLWGTLLSISGATVVVLSKATTPAALPSACGGGWVVGPLMVVAAVLAKALFCLLLEVVAKEYSADMTLTAMMTVFGTLQTAAYAAIAERSPSAWRLRWRGSDQLLGVLYGGIMVAGIFYYVNTWCTRKAGPVFVGSFSPLLIVFSLVLEIVFFGATVHRWSSLLGAALVVVGMYLVLWAKAKDNSALSADGSSAVKPLLEEDAQRSPCSPAS